MDRGVKYYLGDNSGLQHEYVDSTVQNGITYYYAVVAYDHGSPDLPPTETQSVIQQDPLTGELFLMLILLQSTQVRHSKGIVCSRGWIRWIANISQFRCYRRNNY